MQVCIEILLYASADYHRFFLQLVDVSFAIRFRLGRNVRPPVTIKASLPSETLISAIPGIVRTKAG